MTTYPPHIVAEACRIANEAYGTTAFGPGHPVEPLIQALCLALTMTPPEPPKDVLVDLIRAEMMSSDHPVSEWETAFAAKIRALLAPPVHDGATIKHMTERFLCWKLPQDFHPDAGIAFTPSYPDEPMRSRGWPVGTNLLGYTQAEAMVRHMIEGLPIRQPVSEEVIEREARKIDASCDQSWSTYAKLRRGIELAGGK